MIGQTGIEAFVCFCERVCLVVFKRCRVGKVCYNEIKILETWKIVLTETLISVINKILCLLKRFLFTMILIVA